MQHYSKRLKRMFLDQDWLISEEVAEILSANSGRTIATKYVCELARQNIIEFDHSNSSLMFLYKNVRDYKVAAKAGRHRHAEPSPGARRKREFVARRAEAEMEQQS